jgi:glycosyltransferase involved in cell wall biosynthesis
LKEFSLKPLDIVFNAIKVRKLIRKINPDVLHAHYAGVNGVLAALSGFHPFVLTAWGSDVLIAGKSKIKGFLVKFALDRADLITCDAEHMKKAMINFGVPPPKIKIIYFGVDTKKFSPGPKDENLIKKLKIQDCLTVISLRNLEPIYDIETLIKSASLVIKEIPKVKFIIVGKGPEEKKLKKLTRDLKISENIRFVGWIPNDELSKYLRLADVYVSTSLLDAGISASTAEAMACSLPVIVTNTGENEKWIRDGENGFLIPLKNSEILAERIIFLLKNKEIGKKFGIKARKIIFQRNNYYKEMEKMERLYFSFFKFNDF